MVFLNGGEGNLEAMKHRVMSGNKAKVRPKKPAKPESPRIYGDLAAWFHLMTHPREYGREAKFIRGLLKPAGARGRPTLLELGAGGGNNASHLKKHFDLTLSDLSPAMLKVSRALNPECRHVRGDMRALRLKREFDAVLVHDAVMYMLSAGDLKRMAKTVALHLKPGGRALVLPDFTTETFAPRTTTGGETIGPRTLRYVEVTRGTKGARPRAVVDYTILLQEKSKSDRIVVDRHVFGLFPRKTWIDVLKGAGLRVKSLVDPWERDVFLCEKPKRIPTSRHE